MTYFGDGSEDTKDRPALPPTFDMSCFVILAEARIQLSPYENRTMIHKVFGSLMSKPPEADWFRPTVYYFSATRSAASSKRGTKLFQ